MGFFVGAVPAGIGELTAWVSAGSEDRAGNSFYVTGKLREGGAVTLAGAFDTEDISAIRALTHALVRAVDALDPDKGSSVRLAVAWPESAPARRGVTARAKTGADGDRGNLLAAPNP